MSLHVHPALIASLLVLGWIAVAATRFRWPLIVDLAAIALYARFPSLATLATVGVQAAVRYVPELARELALVLHTTTLAGWPREVALFVLPGLARYAAGEQATRALPSTLPPTPNPQLPTPDLPLLALHEWLHTLNADATVPMVGVVGATRLGKTTLVLVLLRYRAGSLVITTPKARSTDPWGALPPCACAWTSSAAAWTGRRSRGRLPPCISR